MFAPFYLLNAVTLGNKTERITSNTKKKVSPTMQKLPFVGEYHVGLMTCKKNVTKKKK